MSGQLLHNLLLFGRVLRKLGLDINPGRMMDLISALDYIEIALHRGVPVDGEENVDDFFFAARTLLVHDREDLPLFDEAFELFWRKPSESWDVEWQGLTRRRKPSGPIVTHPPLKEAQPQSDGSASSQELSVIEVTRTYSDRELLRHKNFAEMNTEESDAVKQMMSHLLWKVSERRTRRHRPGKGHLIDLRRTLKILDCLVQVVVRSPIPEEASLQVALVRFRIHPARARQLFVLRRLNGDLDFSRDLPRQFTLKIENVSDVAIVALCPEVRVARRMNQLRRDPHAIARSHDRAFHDAVDAELVGWPAPLRRSVSKNAGGSVRIA